MSFCEQGLLKEIHDKDHDVQLTILHAEQLIRSVGHVRSDQHEASHQVQLLKSNTADVKAHFHSVGYYLYVNFLFASMKICIFV